MMCTNGLINPRNDACPPVVSKNKYFQSKDCLSSKSLALPATNLTPHHDET